MNKSLYKFIFFIVTSFILWVPQHSVAQSEVKDLYSRVLFEEWARFSYGNNYHEEILSIYKKIPDSIYHDEIRTKLIEMYNSIDPESFPSGKAYPDDIDIFNLLITEEISITDIARNQIRYELEPKARETYGYLKEIYESEDLANGKSLSSLLESLEDYNAYILEVIDEVIHNYHEEVLQFVIDPLVELRDKHLAEAYDKVFLKYNAYENLEESLIEIENDLLKELDEIETEGYIVSGLHAANIAGSFSGLILSLYSGGIAGAGYSSAKNIKMLKKVKKAGQVTNMLNIYNLASKAADNSLTSLDVYLLIMSLSDSDYLPIVSDLSGIVIGFSDAAKSQTDYQSGVRALGNALSDTRARILRVASTLESEMEKEKAIFFMKQKIDKALF